MNILNVNTTLDNYTFGKMNESQLFNKIKEYFDVNDLKMTNNRYADFDYVSSNNIFEMKSRKVLSNKYSEFMLSYSKIIRFNKIYKDNYKFIIIVVYLDKIKYIIYDKILFDTFQKRMVYDKCKNQYDNCIFINNKYLNELLI